MRVLITIGTVTRAGGLMVLPYIFAVEIGTSKAERRRRRARRVLRQEVRGSVRESKSACVLNARGARWAPFYIFVWSEGVFLPR